MLLALNDQGIELGLLLHFGPRLRVFRFISTNNPLFYATAQATEEAILNALLGAETQTGANDFRAYALPVERLRQAMRKYGREVH